MSIDFIQATKTGTVDDFLKSIEYWEAKQSKAILGGELDGKTTSEARITLYDKVRREILLHDVRQIQPTLNAQLIKPIVLFNGMFAEDRMPVLKYDTAESVDQKQMVEVLGKAADMGMQIDIEWAHQTLQIPRADDKAKILGKAVPATPATPAKDGAALTRLVALAKEKVADADVGGLQMPLEAALDSIDLQDVAQVWLTDLMAQIKAGVDDSSLLEQLAEQWPVVDEADLQARLTQIIFITEVLGRLESAQEIKKNSE